MTDTSPVELLKIRPSVHLLCSGAFLQGHVTLSTGERYIPLKALGFETPAKWLASYVTHCGSPVDQNAVDLLIEQGVTALPCVAIVAPIGQWVSAEEAEGIASQRLNRLRELISWATGNDVIPFGFVVLGPSPNESYFRLVPPQTTSRTRLGFGNTGTDFLQSLERVLAHADVDEHYAFALSMLHDANSERNIRFRIARYYCCLEALAYRIKRENGSRDAIRKLLGVAKGRTGQSSIGGRVYSYDVVLGAGILRDLLFHGVPVDFSAAKPDERDTFDLLVNHPEVYAQDLQGRVELEIARWSNGASKGQA